MDSYCDIFDQLRPLEVGIPVIQGRIGLDFSEQQQAALKLPLQGVAVLRAGAGSGKTRVLVQRALDLIAKGVRPQKILLVTFTRRAAREMEHRIRLTIGRRAEAPLCTTLHALALKIVGREIKGRIQTEPDAQMLAQLRLCLGESDLADQDLITTVSRYREAEVFDGTFGLIALQMKELLRERGLYDFTSLIEEAPAHKNPGFSHVLVDEAQDLSSLQLTMVRWLCATAKSCWFVGDDDQSIYAFRGAAGGTLAELVASARHVVTLGQNWRSGRSIVELGNKVLASRPEGSGDFLREPARREAGAVALLPFERVADEVAAARAAVDRNEVQVVLGRTHRSLEPFEAQGLKVATVHETKGLEWPGVWLQGVSAGKFPLSHADLEEERRLLYVAVTRARDRLFVSWHGKPGSLLPESC